MHSHTSCIGIAKLLTETSYNEVTLQKQIILPANQFVNKSTQAAAAAGWANKKQKVTKTKVYSL